MFQGDRLRHLTRSEFLRLPILAASGLGLTALVGCKRAPTAKNKDLDANGAASVDQEEEAEIKANLDKLGPEDRKVAAEQRYCPVEDKSRLGSMGVPVKVIVSDKPVFLCCKVCQKKALADPNKTLAKVKELKAKGKR